ncbi:MAG: hypothetical protein HUK04_01320 [Bacteroidaceae bacterium]|nr:hypothetical protein [Bacteroidaceae bacterium]
MGIAERLRYLVLDNGLSRWYAMRRWRDRRERRDILRAYREAAREVAPRNGDGTEIVVAPRNGDGTAAQRYPENVVCCLFEGFSEAGGLADRLRGVVSVYQECKRRGLQMRLHFKHPFDLELFMQPSEYDWRIQEDEICRDTRRSEVVVMRPLSDSYFTLRKQREWMRHFFDSLTKRKFGQVHIYTNTPTAYGPEYGPLFRELFKPTARLQTALDGIQSQIGGNYISVSMRFLQLLGDFNDVVDVGTTLSEEERKELISKCLTEIRKLHDTYPHHRILVNSDSQRMLRAARALPYVYTIDGDIIHFDRSDGHEDEYKKFEKTFLDFLTISKADEIFLIKCHHHMRESGFPHAAAMIGGHSSPVVRLCEEGVIRY